MKALSNVITTDLTGHKAILASIIGAVFTAICAQIAFYMPGNPVPVTLQVFAVICCGLFLSPRIALLSQLEYVVAGSLGAPVFAGFKGGLISLTGPTGGYLIGFIFAAWIVSQLCRRTDNTFKSRVFAGLIGVASIYMIGAAWLGLWLQIAGMSSHKWLTWAYGVAPFIGLDAIKCIIAAKLCSSSRIAGL